MMAYAANKRSDNIIYPGLIAAWSSKGKTNDDEDREILKDLTGNGHDITLNGFAFSEMSGYGGYTFSMKNWTIYNDSALIGSTTATTLHIERNDKLFNTVGARYQNAGYAKLKYKADRDCIFVIRKTNVNNEISYQRTPIKANVETVVEIPDITDDSNVKLRWCYWSFENVDAENELNIELLPEYPDALVFDGVDDYGINRDIPFLPDGYTLIIKRKRIKELVNNCLLIKGIDANDTILAFENFTSNNTFETSYGNTNEGVIKEFSKNEILYRTPTSYDGIELTKGDFVETGEQHKIICLGSRYISRYTNFAFYSAYLFDRSLDEQEIKAFIRKYIDPEYLLPSEILTPDCYYDFSQGSNDDENRETIKDYSGNRNDAVAHNFAWSGMSGYGGYLTNFNANAARVDLDVLGTQHWFVKSIVQEHNGLFLLQAQNTINYFNKTIRIRVSGLTGDNQLSVESYGQTPFYLKNGINEWIAPGSANNFFVFNARDKSITNVEIEILPEYEGALVFDGVDDYISLDAFDSGFKTMFMVCNPLFMKERGEFLYDQRNSDTDGNNSNYAIFINTGAYVAYNERNKYGTFINGMLNSSVKAEELVNKKQLIHILANGEIQNGRPMIGANNGSLYYSTMVLYKFLGFKEALTEDQIQYVINKYNLLDGVDEIEVS